MTPLELAAQDLMRTGKDLVEELRMSEVNQLLKKLGKEPESRFEDIAFLASQICDTPLAAISIVGSDKTFYKGLVVDGVPGTLKEFSRDKVICKYVIEHPSEELIIYDAGSNSRVKDLPLVNGDVDFFSVYAGLALVTPTGNAVGTICVLDRAHRRVTQDQMDGLERLRRLTMALILD
jgi:hypothetical protein